MRLFCDSNKRLSWASALGLFVITLSLNSNPVVAATPVQQQVETLSQSGLGIVNRKTVETRRGRVTTGAFRVLENSQLPKGRTLDLSFKVFHATGDSPRSDPVFLFAGGPGQACSKISAQFANSWMRAERDLVFIDQRGTAGNHDLSFEYGSSGDQQQYLGPIMGETMVRTNLKRLSKTFDLKMYSTPIAMDDVNQFRKAMGYTTINIKGGSYGTRACLVYIRRHGETVRTAILEGCAPIEFRNPLHHSQSAQRTLDLVFKEVRQNEKYRKAFGDLKAKFDEILARFANGPIEVEIHNQRTGKSETVMLSRGSFLASVRVQMYYMGNSRRLPKLIFNAYEGDFQPFVGSAVQQNKALRDTLAMGMLLSVTAAEDLARIGEDDIPRYTKNTYFGDGRIRTQMAACRIWPKSNLPKNFGDPVKSEVQTLVISGMYDPVTPPEWGELIHQNFPNSLHLVVPTAHDIGGRCVEQIRKRFLDSGTVQDLDVQCVESMRLPPLSLPTPNTN